MNDETPQFEGMQMGEGIEIGGESPEWPLLAWLMDVPEQYRYWGPISIEWARYFRDCVPHDASIEQQEFLQHAFFCGHQSMLSTLIKANEIHQRLAEVPAKNLTAEVRALRKKGLFNIAADAIRQELDAYHLKTTPTEGEA